ncbi:alkaline phosphatase D family protein, partial [Saccharophagus degradans]
QVGRTILGEEQWNWLNLELKNSTANFNVVMSSIQVIPAEHPYEKWGNFPNERERLFGVIAGSKAKNVIILSRYVGLFDKAKARIVGSDQY